MMPDDARHEYKFVAPEPQYPVARGWLQLHAAGFRTAYPPRIVNNVYFDTHDLWAYQENLAGVSRRTKVRLRWYGDTFAPEQGRLEVKCKRNHLGWKLGYDVASFPGFDAADWGTIVAALSRSVPAVARRWLLENPRPVLINRYRREYFVSRDGRVRATLDRDQRVYDQRYKPAPATEGAANLPRTVVMEIKCAPEDRPRVVEILRSVPIRVSRNSKYMLGVKAIHGF